MQPRDKRRLITVVAVIIIMAALEVVSIGAIVPFMAILVQPEIIESNAWLRDLHAWSSFGDPHQFLLFVGVCLLAIFFLKNVFGVFAVWLQLRYVWSMYCSLNNRLLSKYVWMPYTFYITTNVSELQKNLNSEINNTILGVVQPFITIAANGVVVMAIVLMLVFNDPALALIISVVLGGAYGAIYLVTRKMVASSGNDLMASNSERFRLLGEILPGVRDVKVFNREAYFIDKYRHAIERFGKNSVLYNMVSQTPRYAIEFLAFGGLLAIVLFMSAVRKDLSQVVPFATLYALAGYRILPALQQIMGALTSVRFYSKAVDTVTAHLDLASDKMAAAGERDQAPRMRFEHGLELRNVRFTYPGCQDGALKNISLSVSCNQSVALVGSSGAGKSTAADIILGLLRPSGGTMRVDGTVIDRDNVRPWQRSIGYVPQHIQMIDDTVTRNVAFGVPDGEIDHGAVRRAARIANIADYVEKDMPLGFDTVIGDRGIRLSGGQRQRIAIARALYNDPDILVLDEATSAVDNVTEAEIVRSILALKKTKTVIVIAHRLSTIQTCEKIYVFEKGRVVAEGGYDELMEDSESFRRLATAGSGDNSVPAVPMPETVPIASAAGMAQ
ncbi:MAG: ABC transporter ATP-binding protein [Gammaproteobacteria bacterium]